MDKALLERNPADQELADSEIYLQDFSVSYQYPVHFTSGLFDPDNKVFVAALSRLEPDKRHRFLVFIDDSAARAWPDLAARIEAYAAHYRDRLELVASPETVPGGEACKNDNEIVGRLQRRLLDQGIDRHSHIVGIGGGAVLDLVGYVAASTHRGVRMIRVPTTVLAQNDSGVGVKTGINAFGAKNFLGIFAPPFAVLNDFQFLTTLDERDRRSGMAEAVKVALIRDGDFFEWLEANGDRLARFEPAAVAHLIRRCAELHMAQIAHGGDPFESGSARPLDFGHWSAHKLEALSQHRVRHGEAVAIGIALDSHYSVLQGMLPEGEDRRILALLEKLGFRLWHDDLERRGDGEELLLLAGLREFQEHLGGELTITLLDRIGAGVEVHQMDQALIRDSLNWLRERDARRRVVQAAAS